FQRPLSLLATGIQVHTSRAGDSNHAVEASQVDYAEARDWSAVLRRSEWHRLRDDRTGGSGGCPAPDVAWREPEPIRSRDRKWGYRRQRCRARRRARSSMVAPAQ